MDRIDLTPVVARWLDTVPELVAVVYAATDSDALRREICRMRCEAEETIEAWEAWRSEWLARMLNRSDATYETIKELLGSMDHCFEHLRWISELSTLPT